MAKAGQMATAAEATALEIFQNQWDVYRKFLKHDYLSNAEAASALHAAAGKQVHVTAHQRGEHSEGLGGLVRNENRKMFHFTHGVGHVDLTT